ncbi:MAG: hypothetical protein ACRDJN_16675, partial [Chloroflexota bacterium]
ELRVRLGAEAEAAAATLREQYAPLGEYVEAERQAALSRQAREVARGAARWTLTLAGWREIARQRREAMA